MRQTLPGSERSWAKFRRLVGERFPYATLYGVRVESGVAVGYERAVFTRAFDREPAQFGNTGGPASEHWHRFIRLCAELGNGKVPEVHFRDGNPSVAQFEESGQRLMPES